MTLRLIVSVPQCHFTVNVFLGGRTQCQALDRTQRSLPITPGRGRTMTHDYKRNGTSDLFAALNVATGEVLAGVALAWRALG